MNPVTRTNRVVLLFFLTAAALLGANRWRELNHSTGLNPIADRKPMPALTLPQLNGGEWKSADHRGQVVLINYWATWCEPCQEEIPGLIQIARGANPKDLTVVGISLDAGMDAQERVSDFVTRFRLPYPVAFSSTTLNDATSLAGIPITILLDSQGRIAKTYVGATNREDFARDIANLLTEN